MKKSTKAIDDGDEGYKTVGFSFYKNQENRKLPMKK